jgi:glycosyltransferase involved in cell wall biosynthesis
MKLINTVGQLQNGTDVLVSGKKNLNGRTSIIVATRNSGAYLRECLDSIHAQTVMPREVIIVDAASTDDTLLIAARYPIVRVIQQYGTGFAEAWNEGITVAQGEFIAFLDSDDHYTPCKIEIQEALLDKDGSALGVVGMVRHFTCPNENIPPSFRPELLNTDYLAWMPGTLLARRELFYSIGLWPEGQKILGDTDWFFRLRDSPIKITEVKIRLLNKRVHQTNLSYVAAGNSTYAAEILNLAFRSLQRKRTFFPDQRK